MKGYRTVIVNEIAALLMVAENFGVSFGISTEIVGYIAVVGNFVLRFFTSTAIMKAS